MSELSRRVLLKIGTAAAVSFSPLMRLVRAEDVQAGRSGQSEIMQPTLGVDRDGRSHIYVSTNATPEVNMMKIVDMMGGIDSLIGPRDIIVIKPNSQWWNQGMTNTDAMKAFIDLVLGSREFSGEVIIADNHQFAQDNSRGWVTRQRNGSYNYNELIDYYQKNGIANVTKSHWHVAGKTALPLEGNAQGKNRVRGPRDGDGYVWLEETFYSTPAGRKCVMTYPVFTSAYSGITIDLKNGAWQNGNYLTDRKVRFINFSALNHHGFYCGVTASVKNLMGVVDMSCGFPGNTPHGTYNTHHIGVKKLIRWKRNKLFMKVLSGLGLTQTYFQYCYNNFHYTGGSLGYFMRNIRMPDLNIITAELIGWGSRTDLDKSYKAETLLAGHDPVALDYYAAKEVLLKATPRDVQLGAGLSYYELNNPENSTGPFYRFLAEVAKQGIGNFDPGKMQIHRPYLNHA